MDCINAKRGGGPKTPLYEGKGPENPGVVAPFAVAGCRGNLRRGGPIRYDVVASYYFLWYDMGGRRLSSWSCCCSPVDGARCRASLLSRYLHYCQLGSFDVDASFLCASWHSFARSHALRLPLPRGKTLEFFLRSGSADCRERATDTASSHFSCALVLYVKTYYFQSSWFLTRPLGDVSHRHYLTLRHTARPHRLLSGPLSSDAENRLHGSRLLVQCCSGDQTSSHRCSSWTS